MSRPVWLTFSRSKTFISSVAKGFKCLVLARGMVRFVNAEPGWLEGCDGKDAVGEVERLRFCASISLGNAAIVNL